MCDLNAANNRILVVDDNQAIHADFKKILCAAVSAQNLDRAAEALFGKPINPPAPTRQYVLELASQGQEGVEKARQACCAGGPFALAFVDMRMPPGWDGVQTIEALWNVDPDLQVVICTAYSDYSWGDISRKLGQSDRLLILKKPFDPIEVAQLATAMSAKWQLKKESRLKLQELEAMVRQRTGQLEHTALHDKLTGLPNRALFSDNLTRAIARAKRNADYKFAVYFLDFDRFKNINDSLGHAVGDQLLIEISKRIETCLRRNDVVTRSPQPFSARLGGDEFVVLADDIRQTADAACIAERIVQALSEPYVLHGHEVCSAVSIGVTTSDILADTAEDMLRDSDTAMYEAKLAGGERYVMFDVSMRQRAQNRLALENDLRKALDAGQLFLMYQPIVSLQTGHVESFESLIRWNHPERGIVPPNEFIPIAEETGLIIPIGQWVLREACRQFAQWRQTMGDAAPRNISVNLSRKQLLLTDLPRTLAKILEETAVPPSCLHLEITESAVMQNTESATQILHAIKKVGAKLDMDDFGTGYSSLAHLHQFPIDVLKIDRSFVANLERGKDFVALVHAVAQLARNLNIAVVAEGIETADQALILQSLECDFGQGYLFSKPILASQVPSFQVRPGLLPGAAAIEQPALV
jgi:diguanylate cyclase